MGAAVSVLQLARRLIIVIGAVKREFARDSVSAPVPRPGLDSPVWQSVTARVTAAPRQVGRQVGPGTGRLTAAGVIQGVESSACSQPRLSGSASDLLKPRLAKPVIPFRGLRWGRSARPARPSSCWEMFRKV